MGFVIENGVGDSSKLLVDSNNRAHVLSIQIPGSQDALLEGNGYNINTGLISISGNGTLIYFKSDEAEAILIETLVLADLGGITHSADPYISLVSNPTGGDLISDASAVAYNANRDFSSSKTLLTTTLAYKGKSSGTLTGGTTVGILAHNPGGRDSYPINFLLRKGSSLGVTLTANASSGSANYYAALIVHLINPETEK